MIVKNLESGSIAGGGIVKRLGGNHFRQNGILAKAWPFSHC